MNASIDGDRFNEPKEATSAVIAAQSSMLDA